MVQGVIIKALSGFYYVAAGDQIVECKARGRFRYDGCSPLVGDRVQLSFDAHGKGRIEAVEQRRNAFIRPAVANIDQLIMIGANVNPITDPFLIDRVVAIAENAGCEPVVCLNKCDLDPAEHLYDIYRSIGFRVLRTSAATGLGLDALRDALRLVVGKVILAGIVAYAACRVRHIRRHSPPRRTAALRRVLRRGGPPHGRQRGDHTE